MSAEEESPPASQETQETQSNGLERKIDMGVPPPASETPVVAELENQTELKKESKSKKWGYIIGGILFVAIVVTAVTLAVVLTGNDEGGITDELVMTTTEDTNLYETTTTPEMTTTDPTEDYTPDFPTTEGDSEEMEPLILENVLSGAYTPRSFNATWLGSGELLYRDANGTYRVHDVATQQNTVLFQTADDILNTAAKIQISPDRSNILIAYNEEPIYRHSFLARYTCAEVATGQLTDINPPGVTEAMLQNVVWGPEGTAMAFVYENNVYYKESLSSAAVQITTDGVVDVIYNGVPDWVYEEEIFGSHSTLWLTSTHMAYATFDDTNVRIMRWPIYGEPSSVDHQYTQHPEVRYPKVGTTNPNATVVLRNIATGVSLEFEAPTTLSEAILNKVQFVGNDKLLVIWSNRVQNQVEYHMCDLLNACQVIFRYAVPQGWFSNDNIIFNSSGNAFVTILPQLIGTQTWKQVVQISERGANEAWLLTARTNSAYSVENLIKWTDDDIIWYEATAVGDPAQQHLYTTSTQETCMTCTLPGSDGGLCLYTDSTVDASATYISVQCRGPALPLTYILDIDGNIAMVWESNEAVRELLEGRYIPQTLRFSTQLNVGLDATEIILQVPHGVENMTNVPLLVYVYAGPGSVAVRSTWWLNWSSYLVGRYNIAVAMADGRGAARKTVDNLFSMNRDLGTHEIDDQISVINYLQSTLPFLSTNRTCMWGWSYGGYATARALVKAGDILKCGIAVAPVTDWRYYDTIYTERYMDVPTVNPVGYSESTLLNQATADALRNKSFMLAHGTADDNVHYQHAMLLSRLLQTQDVFFHQMSYTDENHALSNVSPHLYTMMEKFLVQEMRLV